MLLSHNLLSAQLYLMSLSHDHPSLYMFLQLVGRAEHLYLMDKDNHMSRVGGADHWSSMGGADHMSLAVQVTIQENGDN